MDLRSLLPSGAITVTAGHILREILFSLHVFSFHRALKLALLIVVHT